MITFFGLVSHCILLFVTEQIIPQNTTDVPMSVMYTVHVQLNLHYMSLFQRFPQFRGHFMHYSIILGHRMVFSI